MGRVGLYVFYLSNGLATLKERRNKAYCQSKKTFKKEITLEHNNCSYFLFHIVENYKSQLQEFITATTALTEL